VWAHLKLYEQKGGAKRVIFRALAIVALLTGAAGTWAAYFPETLQPFFSKDILSGPPFNRVAGWRALGERLSNVTEEMGSSRT
jgi:hypothetical protein